MLKKTTCFTVICVFMLMSSGCVHSLNDRTPSSAQSVELPESVVIKSRTASFNSIYYFVLRNGRIWAKPIHPTNELDANWKLFHGTGLPVNRQSKRPFENPEEITEIHADADAISAIGSNGHVYFKLEENIGKRGDNMWHDGWGFPKGELFWGEEVRENRSWSIGRRNQYTMYHEDVDGNPHHWGTMGITTLYVLSKNGQEIHFTDSGLPRDFSHRMCGPERGRFISEGLSASASTMFVISKNGDMYTRLADFDTIGSDPMFFKYTYKSHREKIQDGNVYFSNLNHWTLPSEPWKSHVRIALSGKARISKDITILQNGKGNASREMRVAGRDENGNSGYYSKPIYSDQWQFIQAPVEILDNRLLELGVGNHSEVETLGPSLDGLYEGQMHVAGGGEYKVQLLDFNIHCSPATLRIHLGTKYIDLLLHTVEAWTFRERKDPGRDGTPKIYLGTLEVPEDVAKSNNEELQRFLKKYIYRYDKKTFSFTVFASMNHVDLSNRKLLDKIEFKLTKQGSDDVRSIVDTVVEPEKFGFTILANADELIMPRLDSLTSADLAELESKISSNELVLKEFKHWIKKQKKDNWKMTSVANLFSTINVLLRVTGLSLLPKIGTISASGDAILHAYASAERTQYRLSKKDFENATAILSERIQTYRNRRKELMP